MSPQMDRHQPEDIIERYCGGVWAPQRLQQPHRLDCADLVERQLMAETKTTEPRLFPMILQAPSRPCPQDMRLLTLTACDHVQQELQHISASSSGTGHCPLVCSRAASNRS